MISSPTTDVEPPYSVATVVPEPKLEHSVLLRMPKFSKGFTYEDFIPFLTGHIDRSEIVSLGHLVYPNEWNLTVSNKDAREKILKAAKTRIKGKKCVIYPLCDAEVRGRIHWLPTEVDDNEIRNILKRFGELLFFEQESLLPNYDTPRDVVRSFSLRLQPDVSKDDIPHFIVINRLQGLITVKGRDPMCLHCKEIGHRKADCKTAVKTFRKTSKKKKKSKKVCAEEDAVAPVPERTGAEGTSKKSKRKKKKKNSQQAAEATDAVEAATSDSVPGTSTMTSDLPANSKAVVLAEIQSIRNLVGELSEKLADAVKRVNSETSVPAENASTQSETKNSKKKKKAKTTESYDIAAAEAVGCGSSSSGQLSPKGSLDSGIANETSSASTELDRVTELITTLESVTLKGINTSSEAVVESRDQSSANAEDPVVSASTSTGSKKSRKKKKKKAAAAASSPNVSQP